MLGRNNTSWRGEKKAVRSVEDACKYRRQINAEGADRGESQRRKTEKKARGERHRRKTEKKARGESQTNMNSTRATLC